MSLSFLLHSNENHLDILPGIPHKFDVLNEGNRQFAFDLFHQLNCQKGNCFFSPYSISTVFGMASVGARGDTAKEMQKVLYLTPYSYQAAGQFAQYLTVHSDAKDASFIDLANDIWVQDGLNLLPEFQENLQNQYQTKLHTVNFEKQPLNSIKIINEWVASHTNNKIQQLLSSAEVTDKTRLVLTSAIYMKGNWVHEFDQKGTNKAPFYAIEKHPIQVDMMNQTAKFLFYSDENFSMVEMPYLNRSRNGPQLSMVILLPNERNGLENLEKDFTVNNWHQWIGEMKSHRVHLSLPKFKIEDKIDLNQTLIELGMTKVFNSQADFSGITGNKDLFISKAIHKSFLNVDEKGTEAAAASGISMNLTSVLIPEPTQEFLVDHPFIFLIMERNTGAILFMGRVIQP